MKSWERGTACKNQMECDFHFTLGSSDTYTEEKQEKLPSSLPLLS